MYCAGVEYIYHYNFHVGLKSILNVHYTSVFAYFRVKKPVIWHFDHNRTVYQAQTMKFLNSLLLFKGAICKMHYFSLNVKKNYIINSSSSSITNKYNFQKSAIKHLCDVTENSRDISIKTT